jgi:diguanylate cyclase (GGDEF)-like protein
LTGLANRNLFKERLDATLAKHRHLCTEFAVLLLDLDRFKTVNDTLGHQAGDRLLKGVAGRIKAACREDDIAARLGGDEFAVIAMPRDGDLRHGAENLAQRLIEAISAPDEIDGRPVVVGCSIGIALVPAHGERIDEILRNADLALYRSKSEGRNCFQVYSEQMKAEADRRSALEIDLREAIWGDQLEVLYQPVVDIVSRRAVSVEALARWTHPTRGPISPTEFIPVAEQTGLIVELGNWIMFQACHDAMQMPAHIKVAINLSPVQFAKSNIVEWASYALADSGLPAKRLEFEITEGVLLEETERNLNSLRELKHTFVRSRSMSALGERPPRLRLEPIHGRAVDPERAGHLGDGLTGCDPVQRLPTLVRGELLWSTKANPTRPWRAPGPRQCAPGSACAGTQQARPGWSA